MDRVKQEEVYSKQRKTEIKQKDFREYIAQNDVVLAIVKFLLSIKNAEELPENPQQVLLDYFGDYRDEEKWGDFDNLEDAVNQITQENDQLAEQIEEKKQQIIQAQEDKAKKEEEERIRQEEEANKKTSKKPGKK
ncbi:hypothetical protein PPERSA_11865 [Pseudocohnilembus persalinus]|uniref:Uncharacterized protein n=1 Tax=Pseudocohnilembus persalinus TaxID=266149 RepID=A0A0V0QJQ6_PSEPJ|nr:hypothetical protein PPERSA_11865 [Pseudocohnilembus persalinus]|eukprot:KRX02525.1 hypothetical protein PPERSA_11865 [Pseudocohnilembus persalinus]